MSKLNRFLDGVRVVDLTHYLPGPLATLLMADMGAEVLKIEPPGGERQMLSLGCGLMCAPKLLMLDEPTLGLAPKLREKLQAAIGQLVTEGMPLVLAVVGAYLGGRAAAWPAMLRPARM